MTFAINGSAQDVREIEIREWMGSDWGPDCFQDLEDQFPRDHEYSDELDAVICTEDEYLDLVKFWREEVRCMNAREIGNCGWGDYSELTADKIIVISD